MATPTPKRKKRAYLPQQIPEAGFVRLPSILAALPIGRTSFLNGIKSGKYPPGILLGPRTRVWRAEDIRRLIDEIGGAA